MSPSRSQIAAPTLLVWDAAGAPPAGAWNLALWSSFGEPGDTAYCIPQYLEEHADVLRGRFLAWVHQLGELPLEGRPLRDHFTLRPGFSFWWMTLLTEKSNVVNSPQLISVLKLMALEDLLGTGWRGRIILASGDAMLASAFDRWCRNGGMEFEWRRSESPGKRQSALRRLRSFLPHTVQALLGLTLHLMRRWPLRGRDIERLRRSAAQITLCSYLFHLDQTSTSAGRFSSAFWTELHQALEHEREGINWLLMFIPHGLVPTARRARELVDRFNHCGADTQVHAALDGGLGLRVICGTLRDYFKVALAGARLPDARRGFRLANSNIDLWPQFEHDWRASLFGVPAVLGCLHLNLIEYLLQRLPRQRLGIYLLENIGWEMAFVHAWKAAGHGQLIGVPHSTVRFWDLRYFFDPRSYHRSGGNDLPLPDLVALNGQAALDAYRRGGFPEEKLVEVEALRYQYLARFPPVRGGTDSAADRPLRVLVLGDYVPPVTQQQMRWLASIAGNLPADTQYTVKPHPNCPIDPADYPALKIRLTSAPLDELLEGCDVAYTSNLTSAAIDAYSAGVPVVSVLDGDAFNTSPLRGMEGVNYVTSAAGLAQALRHARRPSDNRSRPYFCLDRRLPRWRRLLGLKESA